MIFGWHEKLPEMFIELLNTLVLTKDEQDVRVVMEVFARKWNDCLFCKSWSMAGSWLVSSFLGI